MSVLDSFLALVRRITNGSNGPPESHVFDAALKISKAVPEYQLPFHSFAVSTYRPPESGEDKVISDTDLDKWFTYHAPDPDKTAQYDRIRQAARQLAFVIRDATPVGPDQSAAIRLLREAVFTANAAIACG